MTNEHYLEVAKECGAVIHSDGNIFFTNVTKLSAYTARICAEKDAEIERYKRIESKVQSHITDIEQRLSEANAAIAMKDEALKFYADGCHFVQHQDVWESVSGEPENFLEDENNTATVEDGSIAKHALSTSPESIAAWEAEKLLPLQRQVAMLVDYIKESLPLCGLCDKEVVGIYYYNDEDGEEWCCEDCHKEKKNFFAYGGKVDEFVVYGLEIISSTQATAEAYDRELTEPLRKRISDLEAKK